MPLEELAFVPVPVSARSDGWTKYRQQGFIVRLALGGCVGRAARGVGKRRTSAYRLREHNRLALALLNALDRRAACHPLGHDPAQAFERAVAAIERQADSP